MTGDIALAFESKVPHTTPWLVVEISVGDEPDDLYADLAAIGWKEDTRYRRVPPLDGRQEVHLMPPDGSALFGGWTDDERRQQMPIVRRVLRKHGFTRVPWHKLTLADLL